MAASDVAAAAVTLATALLEATTDPADAIRLLLPLTEWVPPPVPGSGPLAQQAQARQDALASNLRCAACAALAQAVPLYQPVSYQDAQSLRQLVCGALDLAVRGANLAALVEITTQVPMPSLAEAWTLYQDTTREPQLVASANPPHPLFIPLSFPA